VTNLLPALEINPPGEVTASVIWLHGLGADGHDFAPVIPLLPLAQLGVRVVLPHAESQPVTINGGFSMPAWYDIREGDLSQRHDSAGIRRSAEQVGAWVEAERQRLPAERIAVVGFSQGGAMALHVGLRWPETLAGIAALSTYLVLEESLDAERSAAQRDVPIFQAHGRFDAVVNLSRGEAARDRLLADGHSLEWHTYPMAHQVCDDELSDLARWFTACLSPVAGH
jgi:phospholipase/carboxylesterase